MLVKDLPAGAILWKGYTVIGSAGATIPAKFLEYECRKVSGNEFDYELISKKESTK